MTTFNFKMPFKMIGRVRVCDANSKKVFFFKGMDEFLKLCAMRGHDLAVVGIAPYSEFTISVMVATFDGSPMPNLPWQDLYGVHL